MVGMDRGGRCGSCGSLLAEIVEVCVIHAIIIAFSWIVVIYEILSSRLDILPSMIISK